MSDNVSLRDASKVEALHNSLAPVPSVIILFCCFFLVVGSEAQEKADQPKVEEQLVLVAPDLGRISEIETSEEFAQFLQDYTIQGNLNAASAIERVGARTIVMQIFRIAEAKGIRSVRVRKDADLIKLLCAAHTEVKSLCETGGDLVDLREVVPVLELINKEERRQSGLIEKAE